ncbi:hypothetical protein RQP46_008196 [Phenoliferia psychrophenolica]
MVDKTTNVYADLFRRKLNELSVLIADLPPLAPSPTNPLVKLAAKPTPVSFDNLEWALRTYWGSPEHVAVETEPGSGGVVRELFERVGPSILAGMEDGRRHRALDWLFGVVLSIKQMQVSHSSGITSVDRDASSEPPLAAHKRSSPTVRPSERSQHVYQLLLESKWQLYLHFEPSQRHDAPLAQAPRRRPFAESRRFRVGEAIMANYPAYGPWPSVVLNKNSQGQWWFKEDVMGVKKDDSYLPLCRSWFDPVDVAPLKKLKLKNVPTTWESGKKVSDNDETLFWDGLALGHDQRELREWLKTPTGLEIEKKAIWDSEAGMRAREKRKLEADEKEDKSHEDVVSPVATRGSIDGYSDLRGGVLKATDNDRWGPTLLQMSEISEQTMDEYDCTTIIETINTRLEATGDDWRHVLKALTLLEYLFQNGHSGVLSYYRENPNIIKALKEFKHLEGDKDRGSQVRRKASELSRKVLDEKDARKLRARPPVVGGSKGDSSSGCKIGDLRRSQSTPGTGMSSNRKNKQFPTRHRHPTLLTHRPPLNAPTPSNNARPTDPPTFLSTSTANHGNQHPRSPTLLHSLTPLPPPHGTLMSSTVQKAELDQSSQDGSKDMSLPREAGAVNNAQDDYEKAKMTLKLWLLTMYCMIGAFSYGFTEANPSTSMKNFARAFQFEAQGSNITNLIGMIVGMFNVGVALCFIQDRWGRRVGFAFSFGTQVLGGALQAGATGFAMFGVGRFFSGAGGFAGLLCSFVYVGEVAPASRRGLMGGLMSPAVNSGYVIAGIIGLGFFYDHSSLNWRIPLIFQIIPPALGVGFLWILPESPRWLSMQGRKEESLAVLKSIHRHSSDPQDNIARAEAFQVTAQSDYDKTQPSSWNSLLAGKYKKRSAIVALLWIANMLTGIEVPINYGPTICASLGFSTPVSLTFGLALLIMLTTTTTTVAFINDKIGRRWWIMMETGGCAVAMSLIAGLSAHFDPTSPDAIKIGGPILFSFLFFMICYGVGALPLIVRNPYPGSPLCMAQASLLSSRTPDAIWILFIQPTAGITIGWKFYLVFACSSVVSTLVIYLFVPEVRRVPLEEINRCFGEDEDVAVHASDLVFVNGEIQRTQG